MPAALAVSRMFRPLAVMTPLVPWVVVLESGSVGVDAEASGSVSLSTAPLEVSLNIFT